MQKLSPKHWQPGMVLAKPVENDKGMVLAASGTEISDRMIEMFQQRNVEAVVVQGHPVEIEGKELKSLPERLDDLENRFSNLTSDPYMMRVKGMFERSLRELARREEEERLQLQQNAEADPGGEGDAD